MFFFFNSFKSVTNSSWLSASIVSSIFFKNMSSSIISLKGANFSVRQTGFFLLTPSPWPLYSSFSVFLMLTGFAAYMNYFPNGLFCFFLGIFFVVLAFFFWCRDIIRELTFFKRTSLLIEGNIRLAFWFFIVSEALLFLVFFELFFMLPLNPEFK